jgi:hypothetical protein
MMKGLSFEDCGISDLEHLYVNAGWCGLEIFVMYDIGGATMMEAMVNFQMIPFVVTGYSSVERALLDALF